MKHVKRIGIAILVLIVVWIVLFFVNRNKSSLISRSADITMEDFFDEEEYVSDLKQTESDIEGMSKYDKYEMGLDTEDGADSDLDGLTDKDEIEIYNSNPLMYSTADDFYSDGYKVLMGLDVNKKIEGTDGLSFTGNECPEVELAAKRGDDYLAVVADTTGVTTDYLTDVDVIRQYNISLYSGDVSIDLSLIDSSLSTDDITVYVQEWNDDEAKKVDFSKNDNIITLKSEFESQNNYNIYITKKVEENNVIKKLTNNSVEVSTGSLPEDYFESDTVKYGPAAVGYGPSYYMAKEKTCYTILYNPDNPNWEKEVSYLIEKSNRITEFEGGTPCTYTIDNYPRLKPVKQKVVETVIELFESVQIIDTARVDIRVLTEDITWQAVAMTLFSWDYYEDATIDDDASGTDEDPELEEKIVLANGFDFSKDVFPFENFTSDFEGKNHGNCAAFSHVTAEIYNTGTLSLPSQLYCLDTTQINHTYDITTDPENATLLDKGLHDYKTKRFVLLHTSLQGRLEKNLTEGEKQFVEMMNYYWVYGNNSFKQSDYVKGVGGVKRGKNGEYDVDRYYKMDNTVAIRMQQEIDSGRIVDAYFHVTRRGKSTGEGHAVNIIGYERPYKTSTGTYCTFYVYDNNCPTKLGRLKIHITTLNGKTYLDYNLKIPGADYGAESGIENAMFVAMDHEYNILNDQK